MKKVLIATSSAMPLSSTFFAKALAETYALGVKEDIEFVFYWSPDESSYRNEAVDLIQSQKLDTLVLVKPHIQWIATDLVSIIKSDSLVEGIATKNFYSPNHSYKAYLNEPKEDQPVTAKFLELDLVKIEKEVFDRVKDFVINVTFTDKNNVIETAPMYWYTTANESGPMSQDLNFCLNLEKAEIPIIINSNMAVWEHVWAPHKSFIGEEIKKDFVEKGFKSVENS